MWKTKAAQGWVGALIAATLLASCGGSPSEGLQSAEGDGRPQTPSEGSDGVAPEAPPPVTIHYFDESVDLPPWTYCYGNGCADGAPPEDPADVGDPDEVIVEYPLTGWTFTASFKPSDDQCGREQRVSLETLEDGRFLLRPGGYADTYDVTLFGRGDGDLFVTFRWTTPHDGPLPKARARLAVLADHDGEVDSYGVELELRNLATTPKQASATITVRAANGTELTFPAKLSTMECFPEGTLYWDGPDDKGLAAADLGEPPFGYTVEVVLDSERYVARAVWPDDEIRGNEPSVSLEFDPPLPALP